MRKLESLEVAIKNIDMDWFNSEVDLMLENSFGEKVASLYNEAQERDLSKSEIITLKGYIIKASIETLKWFINKEVDFDYSEATLIKALKNVGLKEFNYKLIDSLNLTEKNIESLKSKF
ncbi:MAG: hypothetical protein ACRC6E_14815 [Fusobacteriaceae bacterium]